MHLHDTTSIHALSHRLKAQAYGLGFELAGIAELGEPATRAAFDAWLARGLHGEMAYMEGAGAGLRRDARRPHPGATHALVVAINYGGREPGGPVARYARGDDYHDVLRGKLRELHAWLEAEVGHAVNARPYVDSGPVLERDLAQRAGLGWFGKNTMLINPEIGSFIFLASLFVEYPLVPDTPFEADRCGTCTRCLDACPTGAIESARVVNANKCISYLTIELRGAIPEAYRERMGGLVYGCDVCQEVCPWNVSFARELGEDSPFRPRAALAGRSPRQLAHDLLAMSQEEFSAAFRKSPMKRAKLRGLKRNAAVVLGNVGTADDIDVLTRALVDALSSDESMVHAHVAWALAQLVTRATREA